MIKLFKNISLLFVFTLLITSCNNDDAESVFGKSPAERQNQKIEELSQLLQSSPDGWKMTYFTDDQRYIGGDQELGGWTFVMKFTDNNHVTMASDLSEETLEARESQYEIKLGSTIKLSFATKNWISLLTDSGSFPYNSYGFDDLLGYGYKGGNDFLFYGQEGDDIILKSNREQVEIHLQKATADDWNKLEEARQTEQIIKDAGHYKVEISEGGTVTSYDDILYTPSARFFTNIDLEKPLSFGFAPTANGLKVAAPITVGSQEATDFTYDASNEWFISDLGNGDYVKIILGDPTDFIDDILNKYYFAFFPGDNSLGSIITSRSSSFNEAFAAANNNLKAASGLDIYGYFIVPNNVIEYLCLDANENVVYIDQNISTSVDNDFTMFNTGEGWDDNNFDYDTIFAPLNEIFLNPDGLKVDIPGSIRDKFNPNPIFIISDLSNTDTQFVGWGNEYSG